MDFSNPMHPMNPTNPNPAFARMNPANVWHKAYTETAPAEPETTAQTECNGGDVPFFACFWCGVVLVLIFVLVCFTLNLKK